MRSTSCIGMPDRLLNTSRPLYSAGKLPIGRPSSRYLVKPGGMPNRLSVSAPWVNEAELCEPCTLPVDTADCLSASATVLNPRACNASPVMMISGAAVSTSTCGINEPVTVTASSRLAARC